MITVVLSAAADPGGAVFGDPSFWVNLGVAGIFLLAFALGKIHPQSALDKLEQANEKAVAKLDQQVERLIGERDRALAERDEMIDVMKNFNTTAAGILQATTHQRPTPRRGEPR